MVITLDADLAAALTEQARKQGVAPELLAAKALRERFLPAPPTIESHEEWMRGLLEAASDCGVVPPPEAFTSEGLYD